MKKLCCTIIFLGSFFISWSRSAPDGFTWKEWATSAVPVKGSRTIIPVREKIFFVNQNDLRSRLFSLEAHSVHGIKLELPVPDGGSQLFQVLAATVMEKALSDKYPGIRTFTAQAIDNKAITARLDFTEFGFHAMVFGLSQTYFIEPYSDIADGFYTCFYKKDFSVPGSQDMICLADIASSPDIVTLPPLLMKTNGDIKRNYRLAISCTHQYAQAVAGPNPTKSAVLSKIITSVNRVTGVLERELAISLTLVAGNDTLIFLNAATDPFTDNSNANLMLSQNPVVINTRIGINAYDIGHVFSTGAGGLAQKSGVCTNNSKAQGVTGRSNPQGDPFDIDFVAHEIGHQFGADHTFNANTLSCSGNGNNPTAYEPGGGSTIMAYAGFCGSVNNLQNNSDDYFHTVSLLQIKDFVTTGAGATCGSQSPSLNTPPVVAPFSKNHFIPKSTPFELEAPLVTDPDHDVLTYCWEQWNRGNFGSSWSAGSTHGPIFRSFAPDTSAIRVFPRIDMLVGGVTSYLGEKLPDNGRFLTFRLSVRDIKNGTGSFNIPDDTVHLDVVNNAGPFTVTAPAASVNWLGSTTETVTWDVANTNSLPVNCANVDILLSVDGGYTYPFVLAANTPNDGAETVNVPNVATSTATARVKVKAVDNIFFNISPVDFIITHNTGINNVSWQNALRIFPVPATDMLHLMSVTVWELGVDITNTLGQHIFRGVLNQKLDIPVEKWSPGVYYIRLSNPMTGEKIIRPVIIH